MNKKTWIVFIIAQIAGEICFWSWEHISPSVGIWLWGVALVLLFPGNFLGALIIESVFWGGKLTLLQLSIIEVPVEILINLGVWFTFMLVWRIIRRKTRESIETRKSIGSDSIDP
jgi:hypothetical protein